MAEYKVIHGTLVEHKTSDPLAAGVDNGSWSSGGSLNTARRRVGAAGIQTAAIAFGGSSDPPVRANAEQYDGTSWTEVGDLNTAREAMGPSSKGSQTAALAAGGNPITTANELWDGSSWTEVADINTSREG